MDNHNFESALQKIKIPVLILEKKWHRLFVLGGKPAKVVELENNEKALLQQQAALRQELMNLKKIKETLRNSVMENMDATSETVSKKLDEDKRLLEECSAKIEADNNELQSIPIKLEEINFKLMIETMEYCYTKLRTNSSEAQEINEWINNVRVQLKKNVIRKKNREINNKEIYSYMHDVFGLEILNIFDLNNEDFLLNFEDSYPNNTISETSNNKVEELKTIELEDVDLKKISSETKQDEIAAQKKLDEIVENNLNEIQ